MHRLQYHIYFSITLNFMISLTSVSSCINFSITLQNLQYQPVQTAVQLASNHYTPV